MAAVAVAVDAAAADTRLAAYQSLSPILLAPLNMAYISVSSHYNDMNIYVCITI